MFPRLFDIPLFDGPSVSMPVFLALAFVLVACLTIGPKLAPRSKLLSQLVSTLPTVAFVAAFVIFLRTPFSGGRLPINSYGFSIMTGFLLASWIAVRRGKPLGLDGDFILDVGIIGMIFGIIGSKINYVLQYSKETDEPGKLGVLGDSALNPLGVILGAVPFAFWAWRIRKKSEPVRVFSWQSAVLLILTLLFALAGTRAAYLLEHHLRGYQPPYSWKVFTNWQSGFVLYGGLLTGVAAAMLYIKMRGQSIAKIGDLLAGPMMLALAFGRVGCFMNGCCHGVEGSTFLCVSFPPGSPASHAQNISHEASRPVHPTQLYETAAGVLFFFALSWLWRRPRKAQGEVFLAMAMLYSAWRFLLEFGRGDERPQYWLGLSYSQVVSLLVFAVTSVWFYLARNRPKPPATEAPAAP